MVEYKKTKTLTTNYTNEHELKAKMQKTDVRLHARGGFCRFLLILSCNPPRIMKVEL